MATRNLRGITVEIGGDTSNLTSALRDVDSELSSIQSNLRTVNSALRLDPGNVDALAERQNLLNRAVETTTERLDTLREAQRQVDQQIANGVEVDERAYQSLRAEIIRAEASLTDYQNQAADAGDVSSDAAEESAEGWTMAADIIADLASEAIQALIDAFGDLMIEAEKAFDFLDARVGATAAEMEKYRDVGERVFKDGWGENITEVTDAMGTVIQLMGDMDDDALYDITSNAMTLSEVFGWDVLESVRAVRMMMNQFGISSEEAFNLLVQGAQNGMDVNGDMLDTINEYSVQFSDAGFTAEEMFNMIANGAETGAWSVDKLGDAVKEYNIRMSDGTAYDAIMANHDALGLTAEQAEFLGSEFGKGGENGKAAMKTTLDAILAVEDETERYKLGVAVFGTMWEDLGEEAVAALFDTEGAITATSGAMDEVKTDAYDNLATSVSVLGRILRDEIFNPIVETIGPAIKSFIDWVIEHANIVTPIIVGVAAAFGILAGALAISGIISGVSKAMAVLNATLLANPIALIVAAIAGLVAAFVAAYKNCESFRNMVDGAMRAIWSVVEPVVNAIKNAFVQAWELIKVVWGYVAPYFETIWSNIKVGVEFLKNQLVNIFSTAWTIIKNVWSVVSSYFENIWNTIAGIFSVVKSVLSGDFQGAWEAIKGIISGWADHFRGVWESIKNIFGAVRDFFANSFSNAWTAIKGVFSNWGSFFGGLWTTIKDKFTSIGTNIANAISGAVKSGINGVISAIESIVNKGIGLINGAIGLINKIPNVNIGKIGTLNLPRLARGGVAYEPTIAEIGEYSGASRNPEIVTPQKILRDTFDESLAKFAERDLNGSDGGDLYMLMNQFRELYELIGEYLPGIAKNSHKNIYLDKRRLVGELAPDMDDALGEIAGRRAVDAV